MASTYLARTCKPWLRSHRDTWRVNESLREARENFASKLKPWVRFRPRMIFILFCFSKMKRKLSPPPEAALQTRKLGHKQNILYRNTNTTGNKIK